MFNHLVTNQIPGVLISANGTLGATCHYDGIYMIIKHQSSHYRTGKRNPKNHISKEKEI